MNGITLTEQDVIDKLVTRAKSAGELAPRVIVISRLVEKPSRSLARLVRFAVVVSINNETLIDALVNECLINDNEFYFVGSEANLQSDMEVDYLYFEASIMSKS